MTTREAEMGRRGECSVRGWLTPAGWVLFSLKRWQATFPD